jgi:hypothetical protein
MATKRKFTDILATDLTRIDDIAHGVQATLEDLEQGEISVDEFQDLLPSLIRHMKRIRRIANTINGRMVRNPGRKLLRGETLTEQEYFFLRTGGVHLNTAHQLGLSPLDEYAIYRHLCYEDDKVICCVNPEPMPEKAPENVIRVRMGKAPEELHDTHLRPEQRDFFEEHLPGLWARFQKN